MFTFYGHVGVDAATTTFRKATRPWQAVSGPGTCVVAFAARLGWRVTNAHTFIKEVRNLAFFEFLTDWIFELLTPTENNCEVTKGIKCETDPNG